jgi:flagellar FliJ protein
MLLGYREDYADRLDQAQMAGITPFAYRNFVAFMGKLDNAVNGQQRSDQACAVQGRAGKARPWQESERKRLSYRTLNERAAARRWRSRTKRDQK